MAYCLINLVLEKGICKMIEEYRSDFILFEKINKRNKLMKNINNLLQDSCNLIDYGDESFVQVIIKGNYISFQNIKKYKELFKSLEKRNKIDEEVEQLNLKLEKIESEIFGLI